VSCSIDVRLEIFLPQGRSVMWLVHRPTIGQSHDRMSATNSSSPATVPLPWSFLPFGQVAWGAGGARPEKLLTHRVEGSEGRVGPERWHRTFLPLLLPIPPTNPSCLLQPPEQQTSAQLLKMAFGKLFTYEVRINLVSRSPTMRLAR
jgi:hypothetical protein